MPHGQPHTPPGLLQQNPLDDPNYDYSTILPFRMRNTLDVDELDTDVMPELAVPGLLRDVGNSAVSMGQMARGQRPPGLILGDVLDFSPAGLLNRIPAGALGMNVFQGSPHKYGPGDAADSLQHIRSGEGALTYGHGRYDAEAKAVAGNYRQSLAKGKSNVFLDGKLVREYDDKTLNEPRSVGINLIESMRRLRPYLSEDEVIDAALNQSRDFIKYDPDNAAGWRSGLKWIEQNRGRITTKAPGYLYKHDLPDDAVARYLDWDKPLSEQPESVRKALEKFGYKADPKGLQEYDKALLDALYNNPKRDLPELPADPTGEKIHTELVNKFRFGGYGDGKEQAAKELGRAGIPGLKYLDAGSRISWARTATNDNKMKVYDFNDPKNYKVFDTPQEADRFIAETGSRNYVTWDEEVLKRMKLLQRNDETFKAAPGVPVMGLLSRDGDSSSNSPTGLLGEPAGWNRQFLLRKMEDRKRMAMEEALQKNFRSGMSGGVI